MDDLISEFIDETTESLGLLDQELVSLEKNPNDSEILGNIFRIVHTIKGTCGFLGLPRLEQVAHASETRKLPSVCTTAPAHGFALSLVPNQRRQEHGLLFARGQTIDRIEPSKEGKTEGRDTEGNKRE